MTAYCFRGIFNIFLILGDFIALWLDTFFQSMKSFSATLEISMQF